MSAESMGLRILVACPERRVELHGSQKTGPCRYSVSKALRFSKKTLANFFSAQRNRAADKTRLIRCLAPVKPLAAGIHPEPGVAGSVQPWTVYADCAGSIYHAAERE